MVRKAQQPPSAHVREHTRTHRYESADAAVDPVADPIPIVHRAPVRDDYAEWRKHYSRHHSELEDARKAAEAVAQKEREKLEKMEAARKSLC